MIVKQIFNVHGLLPKVHQVVIINHAVKFFNKQLAVPIQDVNGQHPNHYVNHFHHVVI